MWQTEGPPRLAIRSLGPLLVTTTSSPRPPGGPKQQAVLALLALQPRRTVSVDSMIDGIWGDYAPPAVEKSVHSYVSNLRSKLGLPIERIGRTYRLLLEPNQVDAVLFEQLHSKGAALRTTRPAQATAILQAALSLWRGQAYADLDDVPAVDAERRRLDVLRLACRESVVSAELACGRHREVLADLEALRIEHPLHEGLAALHMVALYRDGRVADALRVSATLRDDLDAELGIGPGHELLAVERAVAGHDRSLEAEPGSKANGSVRPSHDEAILRPHGRYAAATPHRYRPLTRSLH